MPKMKLFWARDWEGYRIEPATPAAPPPRRSRRERVARAFGPHGTGIVAGASQAIITEGGTPTAVVGNSGKMREYDALSIDGLYEQLAVVRDDDSLLAFVNKFGLLTPGSIGDIDYMVHEARVVRSLIDAKKRRDWSVLSGWLDNNAHVIRLTGERLPGKRPELFFRPRTLRDAIYLQFFEDLSGGAKLKLCERPGCGNWFKYGPGTKPPRRKTARYCSPKCHKAHAYQEKVQS